MKRITPQVLIDRSKPSAYPFDFIFCDDSDVAFIAKAIHVGETEAFKKLVVDDNRAITHRFKNGGCIIVVEKFIFGEPQNLTRVKSLLKKVMKKYLHAESERGFKSIDFSLDNQIIQLKETIRRNKDHYDELLSRAGGDSEIADYNIKLLEATLYSLMELQDIREKR